MRILHVNHVLPVEPLDGGRLRKHQQIDALSTHHGVTVIGRSTDAAALDALVRSHPTWRLRPVAEPADAMRNPVPAAVRELVARERFDVVLVSGVGQWPGERALRDMHVVLDVDSLDGTILGRMRETGESQVSEFEVAATEALTRSVCERADLVLACSEVDRRQIHALTPNARVEVLPNGVDPHWFDDLGPPPRDPVVTFTGFLAYWPNADACRYLATAILPLLRERVPDVQVRLVGRLPPEMVVDLGALAGVEVRADVPDIRPWLAQSRVMVAPIRAGSGTRLKILEAFAAGRPVVSTSIGCEGLDVVHEEHLLIADTPAAFASAVARLLADAALAGRIAAGARHLLLQHYDRAALADRLRACVTRLADSPRRTPRGGRGQ